MKKFFMLPISFSFVLRLVLLLSLFTPLCSKAQTFYETKWTVSNITYNALVIFYDENDIIIRTAYSKNNQYRIAEYKATAGISDNDGYFIDGNNARMIKGDGNYIADNFIFIKNSQGKWGIPFAYDDALGGQIQTADLTRMNYWTAIDPAEKFTENYLQTYFDKSETSYKTFLAYNPINITSVAGVHGNSVDKPAEWKTIMTKGAKGKSQSWFTRYEFPVNEIIQGTAKGKVITDISYGDGLWMVSMTKNEELKHQEYSCGASWPNEFIEENWKKNKRITEVSYGDGQWAVVMSENKNIGKQYYTVSKEWPKEWLNKYWREEYFTITSISYGAGHWVVVASKLTGLAPAQRIEAQNKFPKEDIEKGYNDGFIVSTIVSEKKQWVAILTKYPELKQTYTESSNFPAKFVADKWDDNYFISEVIYNYDHPTTNEVLNFIGTAGTNAISENTIVHNEISSSTTLSTSNEDVILDVPELHLIIVANTKVPDIGRSCEVDKNNVIDEFSDMTSGVGITLNKHIIDEENLNKENVKKVIDDLKVKPNDIVIFIYSGHGFRWSNTPSQYPRMALFYSRYEALSNDNSYNLQEIYDMIVPKGARLNIFLGDCCNSDIGVTSRSGTGGFATRSYTHGSTDRLRDLFFNAKGNLIAASAKPGETACGSNVTGGYFLNSFFSALDKEVSHLAKSTPSWENILKRTTSSAKYKTQNLSGCGVQNAVYKSTLK